MSFMIESLCISLILSFAFSYWLARKTNMKTGQGISIAVVSGAGTFLSLLLLGKWLVRFNIVIPILVAAIAVVAFSALFLAYRFYRDPNREIPADENIIVSPADGRILYIREIDQGQVPSAIKGRSDIELSELTKTDILDTDTYLVGIMMTLLDVHVNRAPIAGKVLLNKHSAGKFLSLKDSAAITENERNTMVFDTGSMRVGMVQIASKQVRRIISYIAKGDEVQRGQRVGAIMLGSQVDAILPRQDVEILVQEGQQVYAGTTVIARLNTNG